MDEKEFGAINVIPFIDIMLVLLTIVLTTSTFIAQGAIPVELPRSSSRRTETLPPLTIEMDRQGALFISARRISASDLAGVLAGLDRATPLLIRADKDSALQLFVDLLDSAKNAGFNHISLKTERK